MADTYTVDIVEEMDLSSSDMMGRIWVTLRRNSYRNYIHEGLEIRMRVICGLTEIDMTGWGT